MVAGWLIKSKCALAPFPFIAVTGYEPDYDLANAPFARVLTKPVHPETLAGEILRVLGKQST
jgi:CheY-like chemotaxis protein